MKKTSLKQFTFFITIALFLFIGVAVCAIPSQETESYAFDTYVREWAPDEFTSLNYGIYWYQYGNTVPVKAKNATNYDPAKPTLIYAHGMKMGGEGVEMKEGLSLKGRASSAFKQYGFDDYAYNPEFYDYLIKKGYNVGVFYWNQLADIPFTSDMRIWCVDPDDGMTYSYLDENGKRVITEKGDKTNPKISVAGLYRDSLIEALGENFTGKLYLTGHSMGGQLTLAVSQALCYYYDQGKITENYLPDRVTIIDPFIGHNPSSGIVDTTGEEIDMKSNCMLSAEASQTIARHGIPIEAYGANYTMVYRYFQLMGKMEGARYPLTDEEIDYVVTLLTDNMVWVYLDAMFDEYGANFDPTHVLAVDYYFSTMYMNKMTSEEGLTVPCFRATDEEIASMRGMAFMQKLNPQIDNANPLYMTDCIYARCDGASRKELKSSSLARIAGTINTTKTIQATLYRDEEKVETVNSVGGWYYFDNLSKGSFKVVFTQNDTVIGEKTDITVKDGSSVFVQKETSVTLLPEPEEGETERIPLGEKIKNFFLSIIEWFKSLFNKE